jgi:hypothetical protein
MQILVSFVILAVGFLIITSPNFVMKKELDAGVKQMASFWIGTVVGYWLS